MVVTRSSYSKWCDQRIREARKARSYNLYSASNLTIVQYPISKRTPRSPFMYFYRIVDPNHLIIAASQPWLPTYAPPAPCTSLPSSAHELLPLPFPALWRLEDAPEIRTLVIDLQKVIEIHRNWERESETEIDKSASKFIKSHGICNCRAASSASRLDTELYKRWTPEAHVVSKYQHGNVKHV